MHTCTFTWRDDRADLIPLYARPMHTCGEPAGHPDQHVCSQCGTEQPA